MKKMIRLMDLVESQLRHKKNFKDMLNVLGYDLGNLFASVKDDQPFEVLLHTFISSVYKGRQAWEEDEVKETQSVIDEWYDKCSPAREDLPMDALTHIAEANDLVLSDNLIGFTQALIAEMNMNKEIQDERDALY
jgi:hypothetical protein